MTQPERTPRRRRLFLVYGLALAGSIVAVLALLALGAHLLPTTADISGHAPAAGPMLDKLRHPLAGLLLQLLVIVPSAHLLGRLAATMGQPAVIGEIVAGLLLGPSLLGAVAPAVSAFVFPPPSLPGLQLLSQIGVVLFMFIVGIELDTAHIRGRAQTAVAISHFSIAVPFIAGVLVALAFYRSYAPPGVSFSVFALFFGVAMSITAFPVLARIIEDRGLSGTPLATTALTCAAVDDVTAWTLLAFVSAFATAQGAALTLAGMLALVAIFVLVMARLVRPLLHRLVDPSDPGRITRSRVTAVLALLLASALATELIGIHALFGAFLAGAMLPSNPKFRRGLREHLETISVVLLLPLFFAFTGLRTEIGLLSDPADWIVCLVIIAVATAGKMGGTIAAARWTGVARHDAFVLGALMNTRGLMELVALNVGYDLGILTPRVFTMMVLMALVTTAMTGPLLSAAARRRGNE